MLTQQITIAVKQHFCDIQFFLEACSMVYLSNSTRFDYVFLTFSARMSDYSVKFFRQKRLPLLNDNEYF